MSDYVYLLRCRDGSYYCGWSTDPKKRAKAHNAAMGAKYTRSRLPVELVYYERCADKSAALRREYDIKQLTHTQKEQLIASNQNLLLRGEYEMATFPHSGVTHIGFNTRDLDAAMKFYCDFLGFTLSHQYTAPEDLPPEAPLYPLRGKPFITFLKAPNGVIFEIFSPVPGREENPVTGANFGFTHFCLGVTDRAAAKRLIDEAGVEVEAWAEGSKAGWIRDPDGNRIEIMEE